ncbi:MAG TPA: hypothetical protein VIO60_07225 [Rectinemataceae bacterium]
MNKTAFILAYALFPLPPVLLYLAGAGWPLDLYALSIALGVYAYCFACAQLVLAARPAWAQKALGQKGLRGFHAAAPLGIILLGLGHRFLKSAAGFDMESFKASVGGVGLALMAALSLLAFLFMAIIGGSLGAQLKELRSKASARGLDYKRTRALHALIAIAVPLLGLHLFLASSSVFARNPSGSVLLAVYALASLYSFIKYRIAGRVPAKEKG